MITKERRHAGPAPVQVSPHWIAGGAMFIEKDLEGGDDESAETNDDGGKDRTMRALETIVETCDSLETEAESIRSRIACTPAELRNCSNRLTVLKKMARMMLGER